MGEYGAQEYFPMTGGDGPYSYAKNSNIQKEGADLSKAMLAEAVKQNLQILDDSFTSNPFRIVDLGCSIGPNTFAAMKDLIEVINHQYKAQSGPNSDPLEFEVFFNDHVSNDFNTLFANLPTDRQYFANGIPGSFHGRLFPKASLNFVYSAYAVHWLSRLPKELCDLNSGSCNQGRIHYFNAPKEVGEAYSAQFAKDIEVFLDARAQELIPRGLMAILISGRPRGTIPAESSLGLFFEPLESSLVDMVNEGTISQDKLDLFNLPLYSPSLDELEKIVQENGCFSIVRMEEIHQRPMPYPSKQECRSGLQETFKKHFGSEILNQLFDGYAKKAEGRPLLSISNGFGIGLFILLKREG